LLRPKPDERTPDGEPASRGRKAHRSPTRTGRAAAPVAWKSPAHRRPGSRAPEWSVSKLIWVDHAHDVRRFPSPQVHSERMASIRRRDATRRIRRFRPGMLVGPATASRDYCRPTTMRETPTRQERANRGRDLPSTRQKEEQQLPCHASDQHERPAILQGRQPGATAADTFCSPTCGHAEKTSNLSAASCTENPARNPDDET